MSFSACPDFVAFDLETTGLDFKTEEMLEIGAVRCRDGRIEATFSQVVRAKRPLTAFLTSLTGITAEEVAEGQEPATALQVFLAFVGDLPLVAHNSGFDLHFLDKACQAAGIERPAADCFDTLLGARMAWPWLGTHKLESLSQEFVLDGGDEPSHRALNDARVTAALFLRIQQEIALVESDEPEVLRGWCRVLDGSNSAWRRMLPWQAGPLPRLALASRGEELPRLGGARPTEIDLEALKAVFAPGGALACLRAETEERPAQLAMALDVAQSFDKEEILAVEAGTGTGKSLAYLVPSALWALAARDRVVVSTATRTLQNQLVLRELPLVEALVPGVRAAVLKGRSNYLCVRRYLEHLRDPQRLEPAEREQFLPLVRWAARTVSGDVEECQGFARDRQADLWNRLCSDARAAIPPRHPLFRDCFYQAARRRAEGAHLLVVNHALLLSDAALDFALLPSYERLVLDEAHHLPASAHEHFGRQLNLNRLRVVLHGICDPATASAGLVGALEQAPGVPSDLGPQLDALRECVRSGEKAFHKFLQKLSEKAGRRNADARVRYRDAIPAQWGIDPQGALSALDLLVQELVRIHPALENWDEAIERGWLGDLDVATENVQTLRRDLVALCDAANPADVYWLDDYHNPIRLSLRSSPADASLLLSEKLYAPLRTLVCTSATLAVRKRMDFFARKAGLDKTDLARTRAVFHRSPFSLRTQARIVVGAWLPKPNLPEASAALLQAWREVVLPLQVRTLGLFTSEKALREAREALQPDFIAQGRLLLAQGVDGSRDALLALFRKTPGSVLLGLDSFWEGVDLPGKDLELVVINRLPFPVPSDPLLSARTEKVEAEGGSGFAEVFLPEAWLKLRQGVGRLLRRKDDRGAILVLDSRISRERYGNQLAETWEGGHVSAKEPEVALESLREWFAAAE
jgi:Rad3-related DNA helicase/DNA polymerase III epsilon subunit-like protein